MPIVADGRVEVITIADEPAIALTEPIRHRAAIVPRWAEAFVASYSIGRPARSSAATRPNTAYRPPDTCGKGINPAQVVNLPRYSRGKRDIVAAFLHARCEPAIRNVKIAPIAGEPVVRRMSDLHHKSTANLLHIEFTRLRLNVVEAQ